MGANQVSSVPSQGRCSSRMAGFRIRFVPDGAIPVVMVALALGWGSIAFADDLRYGKRGNRYEGHQQLPISNVPALDVLSFVQGLSSIAPAAGGHITLTFFLPEPTTVNIEVRERVTDRFYEMRPVRTQWESGWNQFSPWPAKEVLDPLKVRLGNLGLVASSSRAGTPKVLVPIIPAESLRPELRGTYYFVFRTRADLRTANWSVRADAGSGESKRGSLRDVAGGTPTTIHFDIGGLPEGYYRLYVDCRFEGQAGGPQGDYLFYHRTSFPAGPSP